MTEIGELSVEDELRDELRRVRHDRDHVVAERDDARRERDELAVKLKLAEEILRKYTYGTEYSARYDGTNGAGSALYDIANALRLEQS